jgi:hypothetical protein
MQLRAIPDTTMDGHGWRDKVSHSAKFRISAHFPEKAFPAGLKRAAQPCHQVLSSLFRPVRRGSSDVAPPADRPMSLTEISQITKIL